MYFLKSQGIRNNFQSINFHARTRRWNKIGTALKWIAGTPDANDLEIIVKTLRNQIQVITSSQPKIR